MSFVLTINEYDTLALAFDAIPEDEYSLDLSANNLGERGELELTEIFATIPERITSLDLSWNELGDVAAIIFAATAKPNLKSIDLSGNGIGDNGAVALAASPSFRSIIISENEIGPIGGAAFAANNHLETLDMNHNGLRQGGAIPFRDNTTLTSLDISYNRLGGDEEEDEHGDEDAIAISENITLKSLRMHRSGITAVGAAALASNRKLRLLGINGNAIGDEGFANVAAVSIFKSLKVEDNNIDMVGAQAFETNTSIVSLDASDNPMGEPGVALVKGTFDRNLDALKNLISAYVFSSFLAPSNRPERIADIFHHITSFLVSEENAFMVTRSAENRYASPEQEENPEYNPYFSY